MKYLFYLEFPDAKTKRQSGKENKGHCGTVLAVYLVKKGRSWQRSAYVSNGELVFEAAGAVQNIPNSAVTFSSPVSLGYLMSNCKRISKAKAAEIHPVLLKALNVAPC